MANPLIKKEGYGYGYGYGYGEDIPLTVSGKRNLIIGLCITLIGLGWIGYKFYNWKENREFHAAAIAWARNEPEAAWDGLVSSDPRMIGRGYYDRLAVTILLEKSPATALELALSQIEAGFSEKPELETFFWQASLDAAVRSRNWEVLESQLTRINSQNIFPENDPVTLVAKAYLSLNEGNAAEAKEQIVSALEYNPYSEDALFLRSQLQSFSSNEVERNQARVTLRNLSKSGTGDSLHALLLLITSKLINNTPADWENTIVALKEHPFLDFHYLATEPRVLREILTPIERHDQEFAYSIAKKIVDSESAVDADFLKLIILCQETDRVSEAGNYLAANKITEDQSLNLTWLKARQALLTGDYTTALELAASGIEIPQPQKFLQVLVQIGSAQSEASSSIKIEAIDYILGWEELTPVQWNFASSLLWDLSNERQESIRTEALSRAQSEPLVSAQFLLEHSLPEDAITCLELVESEDTLATIQLKYRALTEAKRYEAAKELIRGTELLSEFAKLSGLLDIAWDTSDLEEVETIWQQAYTNAISEDSADAARVLGDIAYNHGHTQYASDAYQLMEEWTSLSSIPTESLYRYATLSRQLGDARRSKELLGALKARQPNMENVARDWAYLSLLVETDILEAKDIFSKLSSEHESDPNIQTGLGFAFLRTGQPQRAFAVVDPVLNEGSDALSTSSEIVLYAILLANGEEARAKAIESKFKQSTLLPEELALVEKYTPLSNEEIELPDLPEDAPLIPRS